MAFSNVDPSKRDEFLAFASLVRSQTDIQQKLYSLETRSERSAYIKSLGFDPEILSSVINSIEFTFGDKRVTYEQWLQLKGVRNDTPLPLNVIVSAMRKSGFNNAYDQLSKEIEQYINELSGYSGGAGTSVKVTTTTRSPKTDTETIDISVDVKDVSDKGISEESQDFVVSDKNSETKKKGKLSTRHLKNLSRQKLVILAMKLQIVRQTRQLKSMSPLTSRLISIHLNTQICNHPIHLNKARDKQRGNKL